MAEEQNRSLQDKFMLRLPDGMRDILRDEAAKWGRSMNAEIVHRLTRSLNSYGAGHLWLELPTEVWNNLLMDAHAHNQMIEDRAVAILSGAHDADQTATLDKMNEIFGENVELEDELADLRAQAGIDFVLYYNKSVQVGAFARRIAGLPDDAIPDDIRREALEMSNLAEAETNTLKIRFQEAQRTLSESEDVYADDA